jgi:hypothetical protein
LLGEALMKLTCAVVLSLVVSGCGGSESGGGDASRSGDDLGSGPCSALTPQVNAWIASHQSCNADSDCTGVAAYGFIYDKGSDVSCWPPLVISTDGQSGLIGLFNQMFAAKCEGPTRVCSAYQPVPGCSQHMCITK